MRLHEVPLGSTLHVPFDSACEEWVVTCRSALWRPGYAFLESVSYPVLGDEEFGKAWVGVHLAEHCKHFNHTDTEDHLWPRCKDQLWEPPHAT